MATSSDTLGPDSRRDSEEGQITEKRPSGPNPADFPDGGLKAWSVALGGWCCLFTSFGWINCIGIFQTYYQGHQLSHYSPSVVAWIPSVETFMMYSVAPVYGKVFDTYGPRPLLYFGSFAHVFGLMMTSLATKYYQFFLAQSVCSALGASALFYAGTNPVGTWFWRRRALAFGIVSAGSSLSGCLVPIMVTRLLPHIGFPWMMRTIAFMFGGLLIIAMLTLESRTKPVPRPVTAMEFLRPLREPAFLFNALGSFFFFWGVFLPFNFLILEGQHFGMDATLAQYLIAILNGASVFGRVIPGWLGDKIGRFNIMIITTTLSTILVLAMWIPSTGNGPIIAFAALFGFTSGTFVSMAPALVVQISKVQDIGVRTGTSFFIISIAALTGNPIAGQLITKDNGGYLYMQIFCGLTMAVGAGLIGASRIAQGGLRWTVV